MFILKPNSGVPIYRQLLEQIKRMAASGQLAVGEELPSIRALAIKHAINPMTVSKVYSKLEAEGILERNRGKPMTVAAQTNNQTGAKKLAELNFPLENLVLAGKQLELDVDDVVKALKDKWEEK